MLDQIAIILVLIGAVNWGAVGAFKLDLVKALISSETIQRIVYSLVGLSALYVSYHMYVAPAPAKSA